MILHPDVTNTRSINKFKTLETRFKNIHSNQYNYSKSVCQKTDIKITIICKHHGEFQQTPASHLIGRGCPACKRLTSEEFITRCQKVHPNLNYDLAVYTKQDVKITVSCKEHGTFKQSANNHLHGTGCPKCARIRSDKSNISTLTEFIGKANKKHKGKYLYNKSIYINSSSKIKIMCKGHGVFEQQPNNHINGQGCPTCAEITRIRGHLVQSKKTTLFRLYFVQVNNIWKVGVTSNTVKERFRDDNLQEILYVSKYISLERAVKIEQYIIKRYRKYKNKKKVMRWDSGNTECFTKNIFKRER